jgi:hypothetical protein
MAGGQPDPQIMKSAEAADADGTFAGVERRPIRFEAAGMRYAVTAGELVDQACEGVASPAAPGQPIVLDNAFHPANSHPDHGSCLVDGEIDGLDWLETRTCMA